MFRLLRRTAFIIALVASLTANAFIVVSETAYNFAYSILSNTISAIYDGAELTSSIGWKNKNQSQNLDAFEKDVQRLEAEFRRQRGKIINLDTERHDLLAKNTNLQNKIAEKQRDVSRLLKIKLADDQLLQKKSSEVNALTARLALGEQEIQRINNRIVDLEELNKKFLSENEVALSKIAALQQRISRSQHVEADLRKKITVTTEANSQLSKQASSLAIRNQDLKLAYDAEIQKNVSLNAKLAKSIKKLNEINDIATKTGLEVSELTNTRLVVRETTDRVTKRIATRVTRNISAMPFESIPIAGVAITVGTIYLEIQDACATIKEFDQMSSALGISNDSDSVDNSFCSLSKEDLWRLTTNRTDDFKSCIAPQENSSIIDIDAIMKCLPSEIEEPQVDQEKYFDMPEPAQL